MTLAEAECSRTTCCSPIATLFSRALPESEIQGLEASRERGRWLTHTMSSLMGSNIPQETRDKTTAISFTFLCSCDLNQCPYLNNHHLQAQFEDCHLLLERFWHTTSLMFVCNMLNLKPKITGNSTEKIWNNAWDLRQERVKEGY